MSDGQAPLQALLAAARAVMAQAHAPYSGFPVGAAVRGAGGGIHVGCNVENASYPLGICAEASAVSAMVAAGETRIREVLVVTGSRGSCAPCGGCRQILREFGDGDVPVYLCDCDGLRATVTLEQLLPMPFDLDGPG